MECSKTFFRIVQRMDRNLAVGLVLIGTLISTAGCCLFYWSHCFEAKPKKKKRKRKRKRRQKRRRGNPGQPVIAGAVRVAVVRPSSSSTGEEDDGDTISPRPSLSKTKTYWHAMLQTFVPAQVSSTGLVRAVAPVKTTQTRTAEGVIITDYAMMESPTLSPSSSSVSPSPHFGSQPTTRHPTLSPISPLPPRVSSLRWQALTDSEKRFMAAVEIQRHLRGILSRRYTRIFLAGGRHRSKTELGCEQLSSDAEHREALANAQYEHALKEMNSRRLQMGYDIGGEGNTSSEDEWEEQAERATARKLEVSLWFPRG